MSIFRILLAAALAFPPLFTGCTKESAAGPDGGGGTGRGGSLARFTIAKGHLYVAEQGRLVVYSLQDGAKPVLVKTVPMEWNIETIYPYGDQLFLGSTTGMFIFSITDPAAPAKVGSAVHLRACDPVVADGTTAYVTLKGNTACGPAVSGLYVHDVRKVEQPVLKKVVELTDPAGLGLEGNTLYVCCGSSGLKVFDVTNRFLPELKGTYTGGHFIDVIPYNGVLIAFMENGLRLYDIADPLNPELLQEIKD